MDDKTRKQVERLIKDTVRVSVRIAFEGAIATIEELQGGKKGRSSWNADQWQGYQQGLADAKTALHAFLAEFAE